MERAGTVWEGAQGPEVTKSWPDPQVLGLHQAPWRWQGLWGVAKRWEGDVHGTSTPCGLALGENTVSRTAALTGPQGLENGQLSSDHN